ncbi:hypothetical protein CFOL_v3_15514 [Cephalotus follicularis]|uniref:Protein odr-4 homolog n=1 Tax=Cephalotus follicularis TaxID=3775 RepID=A0A1Q3BVM3_CEPFO|nr:hypothetical protein CFOL_v3_15514 [Cephalotus follicularis]
METTGNKDDKRKGSKSISLASLSIDNDWVAEHARQVQRMLVGGIKVIGVYVWVSDSCFKNSTMMLCQTLKGVAEAAAHLETDSDERLLLHISYSPRRWTCRYCVLPANIKSTSLKPCDFKMGKVLSSFQTFRCMYNFDLRLPISYDSASNGQTLGDILRRGISVHGKELKGAKAMIDGHLVVNDEPCSTDGMHEVELLESFMNYIGVCSEKDVVGILIFSGSVCSFAHLNSKEPVSQAVADIKDDIIRSLQSRLDVICDEADDLSSTEKGGREANNEISCGKLVSHFVLHELRKTCYLSFPRRVFVPWLAGIYICDYLQSFETVEVLKDHCVELMSMEAPSDASKVLEPEVEAPSLITKSFWEVVVPFSYASISSSEKSRTVSTRAESGQATNFTVVGLVAAVFFLILSVIVGFLLVQRS